ncbi:MAG: hypothetical protein AW12_02269 [Candidatus Accumulibacter sp. BA-94]|nr:MAG: hypothetical protein AW12_02269 [Candidatus Accumulibacter sp. BA-94]
MRPDHGAVLRRGIDGNLELARQEGEFRMESRPLAQQPLAQQFAVRARVDQFIRRDAGKVIAGDVADTVARGLHGVHFDARQLGQDFRRFLELRPVELHVLSGREVPDSAVVAARDFGQFAQLRRREHAVGDGDTQHRAVPLDVQPVLQAQRTQLVFREFAGQMTLHLAAILAYPLVDQLLVSTVVAIHGSLLI